MKFRRTNKVGKFEVKKVKVRERWAKMSFVSRSLHAPLNLSEYTWIYLQQWRLTFCKITICFIKVASTPNVQFTSSIPCRHSLFIEGLVELIIALGLGETNDRHKRVRALHWVVLHTAKRKNRSVRRSGGAKLHRCVVWVYVIVQ